MVKTVWRIKEARYLMWLLCLAGAVAFCQFVPAEHVYAAQGDLTYSPASYSTRVLPGGQVTFSDTATSPQQNVTVSCPLLADAAPSQPIPSSWVSASPSTYRYKQPGTQEFSITIQVPGATAGGTYRSYIRCRVTQGGANDGTGCLTTITVGYAPVASFTLAPAQPQTGQTVSFTDASTDQDGSIASWAWTFGDGGTSTAKNPTHTYASAGTYTVSLTVTDNEGLKGSTTKSVKVLAPPTCSFTFSPASPRAGDSVSFTDGSSDSDGTVVSWAWTFGDGGTSTAKNPTHTYASVGTYTVNLTVTDNDGLTGSSSKQITVGKPLVPPVCSFTFSPAQPKAGESVSFTDGSSDSDGTIVSWAWTFGDGGTSTAKNPTHTYAGAGTYTVNLTVTDNDGLTGSSKQDVKVEKPLEAPVCSFVFSPEQPKVGEDVQFKDQSTDADGELVAWQWDFGDGNGSEEQNPVHAYKEAGTYSVSLTVTDNDGQTATCSQEITVLEQHSCAFSWLPQEPKAGEVVSFKDESPDPDEIVSWRWDLGDGGTSEQQNPTHKYAQPGDYTATLEVAFNDGQNASCAQHVIVGASAPVAAFEWEPGSPAEGEAVQFADQSADVNPKGSIVSWAWDFGDGASATSQNPAHAYLDNGNYAVTLTVTNSYGETASVAKVVSVRNLPPACDAGPAREARVNQPVTFTGSASDAGALDTLTYTWDFGDGSEAQGQSVVHAYAEAGIKQVLLRVIDKDGAECASRTRVQVVDEQGGGDSVPPDDSLAPVQVTYSGDGVSQRDGTIRLAARVTIPDSNGAGVLPRNVVFSVIDTNGNVAGRFYAGVTRASALDGGVAETRVQLQPGAYFVWMEPEGRPMLDSETQPVNPIAVGSAHGAVWAAANGGGDGSTFMAVAAWDLNTPAPRAAAISWARLSDGATELIATTSARVASAANGHVVIEAVCAADGVHGLPVQFTVDANLATVTMILGDGRTASSPMNAGARATP